MLTIVKRIRLLVSASWILVVAVSALTWSEGSSSQAYQNLRSRQDAQIVRQGFLSAGAVIPSSDKHIEARLRLRKIGDADFGLLRKYLTSHDGANLQDVLLVAGCTRKRAFLPEIQRIQKRHGQPPALVDYCDWAMSEIDGSQEPLDRIYLRVKSRKDSHRSWWCFKLLLFSSRSYSNRLLGRLQREGYVDGAIGEELGLYQSYRRQLIGKE